MNTLHRHSIFLVAGLMLLTMPLSGCSLDQPDGAADHAGASDGRAAGSADVHGQGTELASTEDQGDWCVEHEISESECVFCDPSLIESLGWCAGHEVPEAFCYRCNPNLIPAFKAVGDWCAGHDRPESQCYICNPELAPDYSVPQPEPKAPTDVDAGSGDEESIPRTQRAPSVLCTKQALTVTFAHEEIAGQAGLGHAEVEIRELSHTLEVQATVAYDGNRYAQLAPQVAGIVEAVHMDLGEAVEPGDVLATITSPAFGAAKAAYLQAAAEVGLWGKNLSRESDLLKKGVGTEREVLEAESRLSESRINLSRAEQELIGLGLSAQQIEEVARTGDTTARYQVTASFSGVVVDRQAAVGEVFDPSQPLFAVADISRMWALLDVYEADIRQIEVGQPVVLFVEGLRGESFAGRITWVSSQLDPRTRTLQARAELDNSGGQLRANMFAHAVVTVRDKQATLTVPKDAVQWEGCCNVVFVKQTETTYKPRRVHLGSSAGAFYEVRSGVSQGDLVVTQGSFLLKTEILKTNIGAGCCEATPGS